MLHRVAETVGSTVEDLEANLSVDELASWIDYFAYNAKKERDASDRAKAEAKASGKRGGHMGR